MKISNRREWVRGAGAHGIHTVPWESFLKDLGLSWHSKHWSEFDRYSEHYAECVECSSGVGLRGMVSAK